jgi:hypothetical protein
MELNILGPATIAFGAIVAAVIAGSFSYLNLITSKEQKVSEFRQTWIDSLRNSIARYIASLSYLSILYKHYSEKDDTDKDKFEMAKGVSDVYEKINSAYNDIIFRINDNEDDPKGKNLNDNFLKALEETRNCYNKSKYIEAFQKCDAVRTATKPLLKFEWNRVKNGEPSYKRAKIISIIVLFVGLLLAILDIGYVATAYRSNNTTVKVTTEKKSEVEIPNKANSADAKSSAAD